MKHDNAIAWRIAQLAARLDPALVGALWVIRAASPGYAPAYEQMGIADMLLPVREASAPETPWHSLIRAAPGLAAVTDALGIIMPGSALLREVESLPPLTASGEEDLGELTEILSSLSPEDGGLTRHYPYRDSAVSALDEDYDIPLCILRLLLSVLNIHPGSRLYDPCYGSGALLPRAAALLSREKNLSFFAQAMDPGAYQMCHVHAYLRGVSIDIGEKSANPLSEDLHPDQKFDCILAHPPFNQSGWYGDAQTPYDARWQFGIPPRSNGNFAWLQHVFTHLTPTGRAAVILPNGTLTTRTQSEQNIRVGMLENGAVEAIIALPPGIFSSTRIPCCVWLLSGEGTSSTLFVDAQKKNLTEDLSGDMLALAGLVLQHRAGLPLEKTDWYAQAGLREIAGKDYLLSPNFYTLPPNQGSLRQDLPRLRSSIDRLLPQLSGTAVAFLLAQWKQLSPECHWKRALLPELYEITGGVVKKKDAFGHGVPMADVATVIRHPFLPDTLPALVEVTSGEMEKYRIRAGDIFLNRSSESVEALACCCVAASDADAVFGGYLKRLRPLGESHPNPKYMAAYFRSAIYRREIARVSPVYTTRSNINQKQLSQIAVYYPDADRQEAIGETFFALWQFRENGSDPVLRERIDTFLDLFIEQFLSCPIARFQEQGRL